MKTIIIGLLLANTALGLHAQSPPQIRVPDEETAKAKKTLDEKMKQVLSSANGFKDGSVIKTTGVYGNTGFYRNTNNNNGVIYTYNKMDNAFYISDVLRTKYVELGAEKSSMGFPTSDNKLVRSGVDNATSIIITFENGIIIKPASKPILSVMAPVFGKYNNLGGASSSFGIPTGEYQKWLGRENQYFQPFEGGAFWGTKTQAYQMQGAVHKKFNVSKNGMPLEDEKGNSVQGYSYLKCEKGVIINSAKAGAWLSTSAIFSKWLTLGIGLANAAGFPTSDAVVNGSMIAQNFENGLMFSLNDKVTFVPDDSEKNKTENNKIRQTIRIPGKN